MNLFFRILLAVYAFCLTIISLIVLYITINPEFLREIHQYLYYDVLAGKGSKFLMAVIALIFLILSITFLLSGFRSEKDKRSISKASSIGDIRISLGTIENIALAASRKLSGIRETKANVVKVVDGVSITIKAVVLSDISIPDLSEDVQVKVKSSVEETTGIRVQDVRVLVENVHTGYKSRVE